MNTKSSFIISSELNNISKVFDWLNTTLFKYITNENKINTLSLIIQEALANAIIHGNNENKNKKVTLSYEVDNLDIHLKIMDEGEGVPSSKQKIDENHIQEEDLFKDSGRGIILMKHFCKDVTFNENSIELIFEV